MAPGLRPEGPPRERHAWVTLVTGDAYACGAAALLRSLQMTRTGADLVVLHTAGVDAAALDRLRGRGARLVEADGLPTSPEFAVAHARDDLHRRAPFVKGGKPAFHTPLDNFVKLRAWQLEEYAKIVFVDADALVLRPCDRLFAYPEFSAAPNVYESLRDFHRLNSGVFVARPSAQTFERMLRAVDAPGAFWKRTDQTFLESFFPAWHGLPVFDNMLQYVWLNLPELWDWGSIRILHYQYEKPWQKPHPKAEALRPLIDLWQSYAAGGAVPAIDDLPGPCAA